MDTPPLPPPPPAYTAGATDIYPRGPREQELCAKASRPDWLYMGGLLALDVAAIGVGSSSIVKFADEEWERFTGPLMIGVTWGATVGGMWLALPKCEPHWVGETPREGGIRTTWPLALSLALLAGATAPIVNAIAIGYNLPLNWDTPEREVHIIIAGLAGFGGALLPYAIPPITYKAARDLDRLRFGYDGRAGFISYTATF
jgi:hypothetical protein